MSRDDIVSTAVPQCSQSGIQASKPPSQSEEIEIQQNVITDQQDRRNMGYGDHHLHPIDHTATSSGKHIIRSTEAHYQSRIESLRCLYQAFNIHHCRRIYS